MIDWILHIVEALRGHWWAPPAFCVAYALACLVMPVSVFPVAGGVLFGFWGGLVLNLMSSFGGATMAFWLARLLGRDAVEKILRGKLKRFDHYMQSHGFGPLLFARLVGLPPFGLLNYLMGLSPVPWRVYALATFIGILPWMLVTTYFSRTLWSVLVTAGMEGYRKALLQHSGLILAWTVFVILSVGLGVYLKKRQNQATRSE